MPQAETLRRPGRGDRPPHQGPDGSSPSCHSPVEQEEGDHRGEVGGRGVSRQVEDEENNDAASGWHQVVELERREGRG